MPAMSPPEQNPTPLPVKHDGAYRVVVREPIKYGGEFDPHRVVDRVAHLRPIKRDGCHGAFNRFQLDRCCQFLPSAFIWITRV